ncbi:SDR family oxidoreductase [Geobacter sp.]|uniref:UDP-glucose 4-epimerase family protein n=1 Tax=Geobacter sp. TaxID=46610 RepID=UPI001AC24539|nr:SDR family oxidoreductase [Geobacter sp.]CAG1006020.1 UDP-glucose 4-epimerase [Anaerolineales bacterium]
MMDSPTEQRILVTGATGFIGRTLCPLLLGRGCRVRGTVRASEPASALYPGVEPVVIEPLGPETSWSEALTNIDTIIHLAARVHVMDDRASDPLAEFRRVNTEGTGRLAREAAASGVRRLVFVSSIKVNGEESATPYTENSPANPTDPYGISKLEAEALLRRIEAETGLEVVVLRPTLVYGPGVKANFLNLMKVIQRGIPLPLASIANKRSLVYVGNLADALAACAVHRHAGGKTYLVSDGEDVSTPELIRKIAASLGVPARLFPMPVSLIRLAGAVTGKRAAVDRLAESLVVDGSGMASDLGWVAPFTMNEGLRATAEWFLGTRRINP